LQVREQSFVLRSGLNASSETISLALYVPSVLMFNIFYLGLKAVCFVVTIYNAVVVVTRVREKCDKTMLKADP
jgi:hypothetical protein